MSKIEDIVDSLEHKISKVLLKADALKQTNLELSKDLASARQEIQTQKKVNSDWEEKYEALKIANSMLGSDDNKRETKLKINALIRDIDHCIAQLSD
ncbi:hypothetical protein [Hyunsoonleella pacifica]|jgi:predicted RNase H-like nuclease (RuvC/YqgF family)|uniref:Uncharacterized protein n=1 Tax=Hyunsoonleella pacifica TaxID=1080224 RepID=A0A4Q9FQX3_9FLAO|nr:hypothetical protein [Hyunsoonleella pacifica]TBN17871.1 hypothetical protein EYD46_06045 [Hyunsoonleella pacifica]GGD08177.1 hypothetical protein GCM10011368_07710 [Hyunsoonleella pacifica]